MTSEPLIDQYLKYHAGTTIPSTVLDALFHELEYGQWLCPNAPSEYADVSRRTAQAIYAACLRNFHGAVSTSPSKIRDWRAHIFTNYFHTPQHFDKLPYDTPDDMFDEVETTLTNEGFLTPLLPDRTETYVTDEHVTGSNQ